MEKDYVKVNFIARDEVFRMIYRHERIASKEMMPLVNSEKQIIQMLGWAEDYKKYVNKQYVKEKRA